METGLPAGNPGLPPSWKVFPDGLWTAPWQGPGQQSLPTADKPSSPCLSRGRVVHVPAARDVCINFLIKCSLQPSEQPPAQGEEFRHSSREGEWRISPGARLGANNSYFWPLCVQHCFLHRCSRDLLKISRYSRERVRRQLFP